METPEYTYSPLTPMDNDEFPFTSAPTPTPLFDAKPTFADPIPTSLADDSIPTSLADDSIPTTLADPILKADACTCRTKCHAKRSCPCRKADKFCSELCHPVRKCTNHLKPIKDNKSNVKISIADYTPSTVQSTSIWKTVCDTPILHSHQDILNSTSKAWLDDVLINVGQKMLKSQFPAVEGLPNCILVGDMSAELPISEFIQVILIGGNHWIAVSTIGCKLDHVLVYDSLHYPLSSRTHKVVADLLQTKSKKLTFDLANVQYQSGTNDCGLFALAFCTTKCFGGNPVNILYDQTKMRAHFKSCVEYGVMSPFPQQSRGRRVKTKVRFSEDVLIHCLCRLPMDLPMIQCMTCLEWFHCTCIRMNDRQLMKLKEQDFFCGQCH